MKSTAKRYKSTDAGNDEKGTGYIINEDIPIQNWKIREYTTLMILGHKCNCATASFRGRTWRIWYTPDIPVESGPWKLGGLTGLILYAQSDHFMAIDATGILFKNIPPITFYNFWDRKIEPISQEKFLKISNNHSMYPKNTRFLPKMELE